MTRWQWRSTSDLALSWAAVTLATLCLATTVVRGCPEPCQCTQTYFVYCQRIGLTSERVLDVVTSVPREALLLDLSANSLDTLSSGLFNSLPNLESLFVADNQVASVEQAVFQRQQKLTELSLRGNRLREVGGGVFVNVSQLSTLHLGHNLIERIQAGAFSLPRLRQLYLNRNRLSGLQSAQLSGLESLQVLDLSDNLIQTLEAGAFSELHAVHVLRLSRNRLTSLARGAFAGLTALKEIHVDGNALSSLDALLAAPSFSGTLHTLVLSDNALLSVPRGAFAQLPGLRVLALDRNNVSSVGPRAFQGLQLDNLTLAHNLLEAVDREMLDGVRRVSTLDLGHNRIATIRTGAFDSFRESVYVLRLEGNALRTLDRGMLRGMVGLQSLNLSSNALWSVLDGALEELVRLTSLDLDGNRLQWLSAALLRGPSLRRLSVLDNPLEELRGFAFEGAERPVAVWANLTVASATETSVTVRWPYRHGGQLYWTLRVWCLPWGGKNGSSSSDGTSEPPGTACDAAPLVQSSVSPNKVEETVEGLLPGREYVVCVDPVFLSQLVRVSQCGGRVATLRSRPSTARPRDPQGQASSRGAPLRPAARRWTAALCVVMVVVALVAWCRRAGSGLDAAEGGLGKSGVAVVVVGGRRSASRKCPPPPGSCRQAGRKHRSAAVTAVR